MKLLSKFFIAKEKQKKLFLAMSKGSPDKVACWYSCINYWVFASYMYTGQEMDKVRACLKSEKLTIDELTQSTVSEYGLNSELVMELKKDKDYAKNVYAFYGAVNNCKAKNVLDHLQKLKEENNKNWNASAWFLEHACPDDFGKKQDNNANDEVTAVKVVYVSQETQKERLDKLEQEVKESIDANNRNA